MQVKIISNLKGTYIKNLNKTQKISYLPKNLIRIDVY